MYISVFNVFIGLYTRCTFMYFTCSVVLDIRCAYIAFNFFHGFDTPDEDICI